MLMGSGFMIILVMVLLRRIRKKMVEGSEGRKKMAVYPKPALPRKWPRWSINRSCGEEGGDWATGGEEKWGAFQVF